jgi:hypothetical protein
MRYGSAGEPRPALEHRQPTRATRAPPTTTTGLPASSLLGLQRSAGNRAVTAALTRAVGMPTAVVLREATRPRAATGSASVVDVGARTKGATGKVTAGSLARMEWESLFQRHFIEPDQVENEVESAHARYLYSRTYGWIDAQHFFAHIQYAEESGPAAAAAKGIDIEVSQQRVRNIIGPVPDDNTAYSDLLEHDLIDPADFLHYRETTYILAAMFKDRLLGPQERALVKGLNEEQLAKLILDTAKSAWSAEDMVSNQLGIQFFRLYGQQVNQGASAAEVRSRFMAALTDFFAMIEVLDDPAAVKREAAGLPGKERWKAPKMTLDQARKRVPELFDLDDVPCSVRADFDTNANATSARQAARAALSGTGRGMLVWTMSDSVLVATPSYVEAVMLKKVLDRQPGVRAVRAEKVASSPGAPPRK